MHRIGGTLRDNPFGGYGAAVGIPLFNCCGSNRMPLTGFGTVSGGQFDWGGRLLKSNGGAQRFPQDGWKSSDECKGIRELNCETDRSNRCESRA